MKTPFALQISLNASDTVCSFMFVFLFFSVKCFVFDETSSVFTKSVNSSQQQLKLFKISSK